MDDDAFDAACAQQAEDEARQWEADRQAQLADRFAYEQFSTYLDRVFDAVIGKARPTSTPTRTCEGAEHG